MKLEPIQHLQQFRVSAILPDITGEEGVQWTTWNP